MRDIRRFAALFAALVMAALVVTACGGSGDDGADLREPATSAPPTAGTIGVVPSATVSPTPAMLSGSIGGTPPAAAATARPTTPPAATASAIVGVPTLSPEERREAETLLSAAALQVDDIPGGFRLEDESFITNAELKGTKELLIETMGPLGGARQEDLSRWGRILGYNATYGVDEVRDPASFSGTLSLHVSVDLFQDPTGAHEYVEQAGELALQQSDPQGEAWRELQEYYQSAGLELREVKVSPLSVPGVGEERVAWETRATIRFSDGDLHAVQQVVGLRRGPAAGAIGLVAVNSAPSVDQLEDLARKLDERMKDALEQAP